MNNKLWIAVLLGLLVVFGGLVMSRRFYRELGEKLPPRLELSDSASAFAKALARATELGAPLPISVLGTGSMRPYIPAAKEGEDPLRTTVAYVVIDPRKKYSDVKKGDLIMYRAEWSAQDGPTVMHVVALIDKEGLILTGIGNAHSEGRWRVTEKNFVAVIDSAYVWAR